MVGNATDSKKQITKLNFREQKIIMQSERYLEKLGK
jgi:hypothetical protein